MNLKHLNDACLIDETKRLVRRERELLSLILNHLREMERRRLFGKHASLFAYAISELGYSEDQAYRRIAAMRLVRELPELLPRIERGEINLSHVGAAQSLFTNEKKQGTQFTAKKKSEVFEAIAGRPAREAQKVINTFATQPAKPREYVRAVGIGRNQLVTELSDDVLAKIETLKGLLAHQISNVTLAETLERALDLAIEKLDPRRRRTRPNSKASVRRVVWERDHGACTKCGSKHALQEDHRLPAAMGGAYSVENIRLLCRSCNQRAAIEKLGLNKMDRYLSPATSRVTAAL